MAVSLSEEGHPTPPRAAASSGPDWGECVAGWAWEGKLPLEIEVIFDDSCEGKKTIYRELLFMIKQGFAVRVVSCYA